MSIEYDGGTNPERVGVVEVAAEQAAPELPLNAERSIDYLMEAISCFASEWSLVGGRFDRGEMLDQANETKARIRTMLETDARKFAALAARLGTADSPKEPQLCDFGNEDDFDEARDDWERQQRYAVVGAMEYNGNTVSYMYSKAKNYGNVLFECCKLLGGEGHVIDRIKALQARLAPDAPAQPQLVGGEGGHDAQMDQEKPK